MAIELTNNDVYDFLLEECRDNPFLWEQFGEGIMLRTHEVDFWESLAERLDCFRVCEECGKPMIEGYIVEGDTHYCSNECLLKHFTWEEYLEQYNDGEGDSFWTTWYEDSNTFTKWSQSHEKINN